MKMPPVPRVLDAVLPSHTWRATVQQTLSRAFRATAFWLAVGLPFLYLPLLVTGFSGRDEQGAFVGLVILNVVSLVVGHGYRR